MSAVTAVKVQIPDPDLWRLQSVAERRGMTLPEFLLNAGVAVAGISETTEEAAVVLCRAGLSVPQIARRLNMTNQSVRQRLHTLGMKARPHTKSTNPKERDRNGN